MAGKRKDISGDQLEKVTNTLKEKYPDIGIKSIEVNPNKGTSTFYLEPNNKTLAFLDQDSKVGPGVIPKLRAKGSTITRDSITRSVLDLGLKKDAYDEDPKKCYERAIRYYYTDPIIGSATNLLASLATKGFSLDVDDENIKNFFEAWAFDVNLTQIIDWIMLDFFKVGHVTTYKVIAAYEPKISNLSTVPGKKPKAKKAQGDLETAAKKNIWSKGHLPVSYTVLNPLLVVIDGNLLFDKTSIKVTLPTELKDLLSKPSNEQSVEEKELIKILPPEIKRAAESGEELQLDSRLVGSITYRKQPYERYARPRLARLFDTIEYKKSLREADLSTLDGISNYILKVTIGSDEYPVTSQAELEAVSQLFNTTSKSFDVVWNHTLKVEKIVSPEIESILGQDKYAQVNEDITGGLGITRALLDGVGQGNAAEMALVVKGIGEEINYARRQVSSWIYNEFQQIAEAMGFDRFPKVRWDNGVLKDTIMYMTTISQLVDRRMLSYRTALETLNFDYPNELRNMQEELPLVEDGVFGILGSPWQQAKMGMGVGVQPNQAAPKGTPSAGRPKAQPTGKNQKQTNPQTKKKTQQQNPGTAQSSFDGDDTLEDVIKDMSSEEYAEFLSLVENIRKNN